MIKHRTVIVVGAGASKDLDLPLGVELQAQIADVISNRRADIWNYLRTAANNYCHKHGLSDEYAFERLSEHADQIKSAH